MKPSERNVSKLNGTSSCQRCHGFASNGDLSAPVDRHVGVDRARDERLDHLRARRPGRAPRSARRPSPSRSITDVAVSPPSARNC
jgi:hypothetical protein